MLFKDKETMQQYISVAASVSLLDVTGTIEFVESKILKPILGRDLYKELHDDFNQNEAGLDDDQKELLDYCRKVIAPYVCYNYAPKAAVQLSSAGTQRTETNNSKTSYAYQDVNFRAQHLLEGETACEVLLAYLDENWADEEIWTGSKEFENYKSLFIKTGIDFNEFYPSPSPYRNYHAMRFKMIEVEDGDIQKQLSPELFDYLKEKDRSPDPDWSKEEKQLLFRIKKAIAYHTVATAIPHLNIRIDENGITIASDNSTVSNKDQKITKAADPASLRMLIDSCYASGNDWLTKAVELIVKDPSKFPAWPNPVTRMNSNQCKNEHKSGGYGLF
jgi:hypothetical protein